MPRLVVSFAELVQLSNNDPLLYHDCCKTKTNGGITINQLLLIIIHHQHTIMNDQYATFDHYEPPIAII